MYKKLISFLLIFSVSISMLLSASFSASATSGSSVNILDFVSLPNNSNTYAFKSSGSTIFDVSSTLGSIRSYYVDIVFVLTGIAVDSFIISRDGVNDFTGTITQLAPSLYRVTCNLSGLAASFYQLKMKNNGTSFSYITFLSFEVHTLASNRVNIAATVTASPGNEVTKQPGYSCQVQTNPTITPDKYATSTVTISISESYWKDYDYIDFDGRVSTYNINSISVVSPDGSYIPVEHSFLNTGLIDNEETTRAYFYYSGRIDLTSFDKLSASGILKLRFSLEEYNGSLFSLYNLSGVVIGDPVDVQSTWYQILFRNIKSGFNSVVNWFSKTYNGLTSWFSTLFSRFDILIQSLAPSSVDEGVTDDIQQSDNELGNLSGEINSLSPTIDADSVNSNVDELVPVDGSSSVNSLLGIFTSNSLITAMLTISITMATAGYVFFGKR